MKSGLVCIQGITSVMPHGPHLKSRMNPGCFISESVRCHKCHISSLTNESGWFVSGHHFSDAIRATNRYSALAAERGWNREKFRKSYPETTLRAKVFVRKTLGARRRSKSVQRRTLLT